MKSILRTSLASSTGSIGSWRSSSVLNSLSATSPSLLFVDSFQWWLVGGRGISSCIVEGLMTVSFSTGEWELPFSESMAEALQVHGERIILQWKKIAPGSTKKEEKLLITESRYQGAASGRRDHERARAQGRRR